MTEAQYRIIETMGMNPEDNREFIAGFENPVAAAEAFFALIPKMWPMEWSELSPETAKEWRDALITYAAMTSPGAVDRPVYTGPTVY